MTFDYGSKCLGMVFNLKSSCKSHQNSTKHPNVPTILILDPAPREQPRQATLSGLFFRGHGTSQSECRASFRCASATSVNWR